MQLLRDNLTLWTSDMQARAAGAAWVGAEPGCGCSGCFHHECLQQGVRQGWVSADVPLHGCGAAVWGGAAQPIPTRALLPLAQDAEQGREAGGEGEMKDQE